MTPLIFIATLGITFLILLSAFGWGLGCLRFVLKLEIVNLATAVFFAITLGLGIMAGIMFWLGLAGLWYTAVAWLLTMAGFILGWLSKPKTTIHLPKPDVKKAQKWFSQVENWFMVAFLIVGIGSAVWVLLARVLSPPIDWDEISYHLALIKLYAENHRIFYVPFIVSSNWPLHTNMLYGISYLMGSDIAHHLLVWCMTLLTAWGIYLFGRQTMNKWFGVVAAMLYLTIPIVKRLSGSGLIDVPIALFALAAFFAFWQWFKVPNRSWLALTGFFCGFTAATKLMGAAIPLILGLLWLWAVWRQRLSFKEIVIQAVVLVGCTAVVVVPWYMRSYAYTGNPVWPFFFELFGGANWDILGDQNHTNMLLTAWTIDYPLTITGFLHSLVDVYANPQNLGGYAGGIGQIILVLAFFSIFLIIKSPIWVRLALIVVWAFYLMWFVLVSHQVRYLTPIMPLICLLAGFTLFKLKQKLPAHPLWITLLSITLLLLFLDFPWFQKEQRDYFVDQLPYLSGQISRQEFLDERIDVMPAFHYVNENLAPEDTVLLLPFETRSYYLDRPYFWGHPISQRVFRYETYTDPAELTAALQQAGITHILDNPTWVYEDYSHWQQYQMITRALFQNCTTPLFTEKNAVLYALQSCTANSSVENGG